ncbi:MAG: 50S ribosomal protein L29 [Chitinophagales bacterium]|nr:50S ribosomal protein L29 [Chitinophagales bacterium]MDW8418727.1 50S ribosomal protein L29 [Chitinophagales bacterium]
MGVNKKLNQKDIQQFVTEDLIAKIKSEREELRRMVFNHSVTPLDNPLAIRTKRRNIARMLTELNKRKKENKA